MPNRILKESIRTSPEIDQLSYFQECMFYRLIVSADDFGRYYGDAKLLKNLLFPWKEDVKSSDISEALKVMEQVGLIRMYEDEKGEQFLFLCSWNKHQKQRNIKSKFPDPESKLKENNNSPEQFADNSLEIDNNCSQIDNKCSRKRERNRNRNRKSLTTTTTEPVEVDDENLLQIQNDHNEILDAAEDAGFPNNQATYDMIIELYSDYGKESVLNGIRACVEQGKTSVAYLKGCCKNTGKSATGGRRNPFDSMIEGVAQ